MSVSLFVALPDSAGLSLVTCEFLLFSGVNFETSGLVYNYIPYRYPLILMYLLHLSQLKEPIPFSTPAIPSAIYVLQ